MLLRASGQLETAFPPSIETQGGVENVLRLVARTILALHKRPEYLRFHRIVVADSRQFPGSPRSSPSSWSLKQSGSCVIFAHLTAVHILDCRNPMLTAHQFMGKLTELSLWHR
jgi:TetR/AcrR family transcriptional regulator, regulator of autoinduction and epiphytic fitness